LSLFFDSYSALSWCIWCVVLWSYTECHRMIIQHILSLSWSYWIYNLSEFAITINISSLKSTKTESTYKMYKFLDHRVDYNLLQMKCKIHWNVFLEWIPLLAVSNYLCWAYSVVLLLWSTSDVYDNICPKYYNDIGQRWPNHS
jgi:hypothetical protein